MPHHDVIPVIRKRRALVDIGHNAVGGSHDWIGWFAMLVPLQAPNVQSFMHLPPLAADTSEGSRFPRLAHGPDKKALLAAFLKQCVVRSREQKGLRAARNSYSRQSSPYE